MNHAGTTIKVLGGVGGFMEDKDEAKRLRKEEILPAIASGQNVVIDFSEVKSSTQSFVHALIGEVLQTYQEGALDKLEFRSCTPQIKSLVQLVVDYSLGGFISKPPSVPIPAPATQKVSSSKVRKTKRKT